jgi:hypothetical protein
VLLSLLLSVDAFSTCTRCRARASSKELAAGEIISVKVNVRNEDEGKSAGQQLVPAVSYEVCHLVTPSVHATVIKHICKHYFS